MFDNFLIKRGTTTNPLIMFSQQHYLMLLISVVAILAALCIWHPHKHMQVVKTVRRCLWTMWLLEIVKIIFTIVVNGNGYYLSLYYCSIPLYIGWFSAYGKGRLKRMGDVFFVVGGLVGGIIYLIMPSTVTGVYPPIHFMTIQSFVHHSIMLYLSLLFIITNYISLRKSDVVNYAIPVVIICILAYIANMKLGSNLMFITRANTGTTFLYNLSPTWYPLIMTLIQSFLPFYVVYYILKFLKRND